MRNATYFYWCVILILQVSCQSDPKTLFSDLSPDDTGIKFRNDLVETNEHNVLSYIYFYNGSGVAAGDLNNDGLNDLVFTGNQSLNKIYLNKGNWEFDDISASSGIENYYGWCTGVSLVDINADGWLDIYIGRSANENPNSRKNFLLINNKNNTFTESAEQYGLDDSGYTTHSSFFDYDRDGDLDAFILNHSIHRFAMDNELSKLKNRYDPNFGSKLYQNQSGKFVDVSQKAGINSNVISFGLGISVGDVNEDDWPDIYVSNDFKEQDYLYINQRDGTFKNEIEARMDHISLFSMGSEMEDVNNDGHMDLITLDMLPPDNQRLKMTSGAENFDKFQLLHDAGFYWQYMRNMFQLNNGDGTFSEIGCYAGISSTDWSWSPLVADYNNDGFKDLFITNGYARDYTNMDFIKFLVDYQAERVATGKELKPLELIAKMPSSEIHNYIFSNKSNFTFKDESLNWGLIKKGISSGAVYSDLDNDGDLDLVVANINDYVSVYRNNTQTLAPANFLNIKLSGADENPNGIGTKISIYSNGILLGHHENYWSRGYESSVDGIIHFGLGSKLSVDSAIIQWPKGNRQIVKNLRVNSLNQIAESDSLPQIKSRQIKPVFTEAESVITYQHQENEFNDFKIQPLLPHFFSRSGPCLAKGDLNKDGLEDIFIGGAKGFPSKIYLQSSGKFKEVKVAVIENDLTSEDVDALFFDADKDGDQDLYVVSGGYEFNDGEQTLQDRLYLNKGNLSFLKVPLPPNATSKSCVEPIDFDNDGDIDLFVGGKLVPGSYPKSPASALYENMGQGVFRERSELLNPSPNLGMVNDAASADVNKDGLIDLIVTGEWMPIKFLINHKNGFFDETDKYQPIKTNGWWNKISVVDIDLDGDMDFILGNLGLNSLLQADNSHRATIHITDIDNNGSIDPVLSFFMIDKSYPSPFLDDFISQVPSIKKKYLHYSDFAEASIETIIPQNLAVQILEAEMFESVIMKNDNGKWSIIPLPAQAQWSPLFSILPTDVNDDKFPDLILSGNLSFTRIRFGRYDANHGLVLVNDKRGNFTAIPDAQSGLKLRGDVRSSVEVNGNFIFGVNSSPIKSYRKN